VRRKTQFT